MFETIAVTPLLESACTAIEAATGIPCILGPRPTEPTEPTVTLLFGGIDRIERNDTTEEDWDPATIVISAVAILSAKGDGPGTYLDRLSTASLRLATYLAYWRSVPIAGPDASRHFTIAGERRPSAVPFYRSDDPGRTDYLYEEAYDTLIRVPGRLPALDLPSNPELPAFDDPFDEF